MEIVGYTNYLIYEDGRVWSKNRNKFRKAYTDTAGYKRTSLSNNNKSRKYLVHRLVAEAYIPNDDNKPCVDHIDRDKSNNHVSNLRWVSHIENMNNLGEYKNNTSGHKNISKNGNGWIFNIVSYKIRHNKSFKTLDEAIEYKNNYLLNI
tara:strand:- start:45 stop:491 length:447 start_codon:yes stop_codon:yes gene_type:complete